MGLYKGMRLSDVRVQYERFEIKGQEKYPGLKGKYLFATEIYYENHVGKFYQPVRYVVESLEAYNEMSQIKKEIEEKIKGEYRVTHSGMDREQRAVRVNVNGKEVDQIV